MIKRIVLFVIILKMCINNFINKYVVFLSACKSLIKRIFTVWLWSEWLFRISECGQTFYKSINVLHNFTDNVSIIKYIYVVISL